MSESSAALKAKKRELSEIEHQHPSLFQKDSGLHVERRVKVLTHGMDDTADPCIPIEFTLPNGKLVCALYFSGGRVIHYSSMLELLRGGMRPFQKIEVQTRDGEALVMEPYHQAEAIWDTELISYKNLNTGATCFIGHGGMMERVERGIPCSVAQHNFRRSRHSFSVEFDLDPKTNECREIWKNLGPVHGNRPTTDGRWISQDENQLHAHGYGSRMIRDEHGEVWRDHEGYTWMTYEEVTDEMINAKGNRIPFGTKIFARRMNADLTIAVGAAVLLSSYSSWENPTKPFAASYRKDPDNHHSGYLVEGPNPILLKVGQKEYWTIFFSAGDFVSEYGNFMMFREKSAGPIGPYQHVVDAQGELIDLTKGLVEKYDLTWAGRMNCFYDHQGNLWGLMHGIFKSDIPDEWQKCGWPRTPDEFINYARRTILIPLSSCLRGDEPFIEVI